MRGGYHRLSRFSLQPAQFMRGFAVQMIQRRRLLQPAQFMRGFAASGMRL